MPDNSAPDSSVTDADFDLGRAALLEITSAETVGANAGSIDEGEGVVSVHFETTMGGYPGWHWTVSIARLEGVEPSVLETELLPGDGALLAPDWIPWVDRLADYRAAQEAAGLAAEELDAESSESDDDEDDDDDELDSDVLHGGDLDGVDIDGDPEDDDPEDDDAEDDDSDDDADEDDLDEEDGDLDDHIEDDDELPVSAVGVEDPDQA